MSQATRLPPAPPQLLDPRLLGRPVHLLPQFAVQLGDDLDAALRSPGGRRYWDGFRLETVGFGPAPAPEEARRWLRFAVGDGSVGIAFERALLLGVLDRRYGRRAGAPPADRAGERVSATEERLAIVLGQQLAALLAARMGAGASAAVTAPPLAGRAPARDSWILCVQLRDAATGEHGRYWLALDQALTAAVLQGLLPARATPRPAPPPAAPLASRLQVRLDGRMVSKEISLETLFCINVGDIIPIQLGRADVLLSDSRLFTAIVSENNGVLCLSSFEESD